MMRSCPPLSAELFKFRLTDQRSPHLFDPQEEAHSIHSSGMDDESVTSASDCYEKNRSHSIESADDRPLNLSCKRRKVEEYDEVNDSSHNPQTEAPQMACQSKLLHPAVANTAIEQAVLQYHAQMLASSDIIRALAQKRWEESLGLHRSLLTPASMPTHYNPWLPTARFNSYQPLFYPVTSSQSILGSSVTETVGDQVRKIPIGQLHNSPSSPILVTPTLSPTSSIEIKSGLPVSNSSTDFALKSQSVTLPLHQRTPVIPQKTLEAHHEPPSLSPISQCSLSPKPTVEQESRKRKRSRKFEDKTNDKDSYPCSICGASYPHKFELNRHIKVSHVRPHRCNECGKGFGHRNYLKVHIETVHLGQKSHQCRLCGKFLSTGGNLNVHVRTIHFGEKKYNCPVCSRSFGQQCNMKTHMKRHYTKSD